MRLLLSLALTAGAVSASSSWIRLESPPFEIYTDAGEKSARDVLRTIEQAHQVFRNFEFKDLPLPVRIFVFSSSSEFRAYRPTETSSAFFQGGSDRDYIAMSTGAGSRIICHEYVHLALNHSSAALPRWFEEGLAEYYSTIESSGDRLRIGRAIPEHVETLRLSRWLNARQLASIGRDPTADKDRGGIGLFYAQSWALVHMLSTSPAYRDGNAAFSDLLAGGAATDEAFVRAFGGRTLDDAIEDLRDYLASGRFGVAQVPISPIRKREAGRAQPVPDIDAKLAKVELLFLLGRTSQVEKLLGEITRREAPTPETESTLGLLALRRGRLDEARSRFAHAIEMGSGNAGIWFEYAMLLRDAREPDAEVLRLLRKAAELNPKYAEAHFVIGTMEAKAGRHAEAVESLRKAAEVLPRQSNFWHAMAISYVELGQKELAHRAAQRAFNAAANLQELQAAKAALALSAAQPQNSKF